MDRIDAVVAQWRAARPDLDGEAIALGGRLIRLAQALGGELLRGHAERGLPEGGFDVLATLRRSSPSGALSPTALYRELLLASGTLTNRLDRLETLGLIARTPDPADGRGSLVRLTPKGRARVEQALEEHVAAEARFFARLNPAERKRLLALLRKLEPAPTSRRGSRRSRA